VEIHGDHLSQSLFKGIAWDEACLMEIFSGNLGARTEFLDAD